MSASTPQTALLVITKSNWGGAQRYVLELAIALQARGTTVLVASGGTEGGLTDQLRAAHIPHQPIHALQRDIGFTKELKAALELKQIIQEFQPDIVHLNSSKAGGTGALVSRLLGVKTIIYTAHGWPHNEDRPYVAQRLIWLASWVTGLLAHHIITVSAYDKKTAPGTLVRSKCVTIPTGVPDIQFVDRAAAQAKLRVTPKNNQLQLVTIAELTANKNLRFATDAVIAHNQTHHTQIHYTIIGDGELRDALAQHIAEHGAGNITLAGHIAQARDYLRAFDAFLLPSKKEGLPYALLEAAAAGLPLIASHVGGIPEVIAHDSDGILIDPTNATTLADALHAMTDASRRRDYSHAAAALTQHFTLAHMLTATLTLYDEDSSTTSSISAASRARD